MKRTITLLVLSLVLSACQSIQAPADHETKTATTAHKESFASDIHNSGNEHAQSKQPASSKTSKPKQDTSPSSSSKHAKKQTQNKLHASLKNQLSAPSDLVPVVVSKETDGDTLHVTMPDGSDEKIRLLLIDTPEDVDSRKPVEPFSLKAAAYARKELPIGEHVYLEEGKFGHRRDKYGRLLAYVWINKHDLYNADVVKKGLARVAYVYPPNTDHLSLLKKKQQYAKSHDLGIWSISNYVSSEGYNLTIACHWADQHDFPDRGCPSHLKTSSQDEHKSSGGESHQKPTSSTSLEVVASNLDVSPGQYASITVKTSPRTTGSIEVDYKSGPSHAQGLDPKTANSSGQITWQWMVGTNTTPGSWPVKITAGEHTITKYLHVH